MPEHIPRVPPRLDPLQSRVVRRVIQCGTGHARGLQGRIREVGVGMTDLPELPTMDSGRVQIETYGESASMFRSHQIPWFLRSRRKAGRSMSLQFHSALKVLIDTGAGRRLAESSRMRQAPRNQYQVTTPKLPPSGGA